VVIRKQRGVNNSDIAYSLGLCENTLLKHYSVELSTARDSFSDEVFGKFAEKIREGSEKSIHFYLTHQLKWSSGDKDREIEGSKEVAAAMAQKAEADALTATLKGHIYKDTAIQSEIVADERS
jgi:hypothetical protein